MSTGWIICLAVVSQASHWGNANPQTQWQAGSPVAAQQPQQAATTNQFATSSRFGGGQAQTNSQFAAQTNATQSHHAQNVDQFGRPIINAQNVNQQPQQSWQHQPPQTSRFGTIAQNNQQPTGAAGTSTQFNPQVVHNNQNTSLNPNTVNQFSGNNQQTTNWQNANSQQVSAPLLAPPQNQTQNGWPNQQQPQSQNGWPTNHQPQIDPRTGQPLVGNQQSVNVNATWPNAQQQQNTANPNGQFNNSFGQPQVNATVGGGDSRFGAQISLGDNRFRVANNTTAGQQSNWGQQGVQHNNQQPLGLQAPQQATPPVGSNQQQDLLQPNLNPHQMTQPPRVGEPSSQAAVASNDTRWPNLQQASQGVDTTNQPNSGDLQPIPNGQANHNLQPIAGITTQDGNSGTQQPANQQQQPAANGTQGTALAQGGNSQSLPNTHFGATANPNINSPSTAFGQYPQPQNVGRNGMLLALNPDLGNMQDEAKEDKEASGDGYTPTPFAFGASLVFNFLMVGGVLYLGWVAFESHFRYRRALLDGDDYDDRGDDRGSRRR